MRKLLITRGAQGAGKSTAIRELGLLPWCISADRFREAFTGPVMTLSGSFGIAQDRDAFIWKTLYDNLEERMARGELLVMDATHKDAKTFKRHRELAKRYRYDVACLDFSPMPLKRCLEQNRARDEHRVVPEDIVKRTWETTQRATVPDDIRRFAWDDGVPFDAIREWLSVPVRDLSSYRAVMHIGDLQGCAWPLTQLLPNGFEDDVFYIFVGDICDRGPENAEALRWVLEPRPNVVVVWGNHEDHLHRWAKGLEGKSDEFDLRTRPQLEEGGIRKEDVDGFCDRLVDLVQYTYNDHNVFVTHAGMPDVPDHPERIASHQWARGIGFYSDPIDAIFDEHAKAGWVQVHGHRNVDDLPLRAAPRSYNLEDKVEFGGHLRALRLDENGFEEISIRNRVYRTIHDRIAIGKIRDKKMYPQWVCEGLPERPTIDPAIVQAMRDHALIQEKRSAEHPHIASFNFTRDAFFDKAWDELNVTARGLFLDVEREEIVARSYDKFFNLDERPETTLNALRESLVFPVDAWVKENGYLGLIGYDAHRDELVYASKSSLEGDFAGWLREIAFAALDEGKRDKLRRFLRDAQATMVFEVVDPIRDPHMIAYDEAKLILLDVVRRDAAFQRMHYKGLQHVGKRFGLEVKARAASFSRFDKLAGFIEVAREPGFAWKGRHLEGFVFEDAAGFQTKLKLDFYAFWKRMRSLKDRILKVRGTNKDLGRDISEPRVADFVEWAQRQPDEVLAKDIIAVRELYLAGVDHEWTAPVDTRPDPKVLGFERALAGIAGNEIKATTADKLLAKALAHDGCMAVLRESELRVPLIMAATPGDARQDAAELLGIDID